MPVLSLISWDALCLLHLLLLSAPAGSVFHPFFFLPVAQHMPQSQAGSGDWQRVSDVFWHWMSSCEWSCAEQVVRQAPWMPLSACCGLGTENHPLALDGPVTRFAEYKSIGAIIQLPGELGGLIWVFWGQTLPHKWRKRDRGFISVSPNLNAKLIYRGERPWRIIPLLYFAFSISSGCYSVDETKEKKKLNGFLHLPFTVFFRCIESAERGEWYHHQGLEILPGQLLSSHA